MDNNSVTVLQLYTPGVYNLIVDLVLSAVLFGILTVLAIVSVGHLVRRDIKRPSTALMFSSLLILYASSTMHLGAVVTYSVGYCRLLNDAVSALPSGSSVDAAIMHFRRIARTSSYIASVALAINVAIGDAVVWWRACVLWPRKSVIVLGIVFQAVTFGLGILSILRQSAEIDFHNQLLLRFADVYGAVSGSGSLLTNVTATLLIGWKAWEHRRILLLAQGGSTLKGRWITPSMRILTLLVESGMVYSVFLAVAVAYNLAARRPESSPPSSAEAKFLSAIRTYLPGCFPPILAIYPMVIIVVVALNRSPIEGSLSPSDIAGPTLAFRGGHSDVHVSLSDTGPGSECTFNSVEVRFTDWEPESAQGRAD